jgi:hypothetical protein
MLTEHLCVDIVSGPEDSGTTDMYSRNGESNKIRKSILLIPTWCAPLITEEQQIHEDTKAVWKGSKGSDGFDVFGD